MATQKIERAAWRSFFDAMSEALAGKQAEIEVDALNLGSQIEAEWLPLYGVTYDDKDDLFEVALEGLDHLIRQPREVSIVTGRNGIDGIEVVDGDGTAHIITLREPLAVPPASLA